MKTQTRKNGTISVTLELDGDRQCTVNTGCTDPKEAKAVIEAANLAKVEVLAKAKQLSRDLLRKLTIAGTVIPSEAIKEWSDWLRANANSDNTAHSYVRNVETWYYKNSPEHLADVTDTQLSDFVNADDSTKRSTRKIRLAGLRSFFGYCAAKDYITPDPSRLVRVKMKQMTHEQKESRKKVPMTDEEVQKVVDRIVGIICKTTMKRHPKYYETARLPRLMFWHSAILIGRRTGLRFGDICNLQWKCFGLEMLTVWTDKSDVRVELQITEEIREAIRTIPPSGQDWCFPREHRLESDMKKRTVLCNEFRAHLKGAGVDTSHTFHDLRHTRATELYQQGMAVPDISRALGHSSPEITRRYIHAEALIVTQRELEQAKAVREKL